MSRDSLSKSFPMTVSRGYGYFNVAANNSVSFANARSA